MKCQDEECINVGFNYLISKVALCIHPCGLPPLCLYPYHQKYKLNKLASILSCLKKHRISIISISSTNKTEFKRSLRLKFLPIQLLL